MSEAQAEASTPRWARWSGPLVVAGVFAAMAGWTWRMWADPLIDFGGEAYVAWRLSVGDVLYRDLAYFTGPLAPYVTALWMRLFGVGLSSLAVPNLVQLALTTLLSYRLCAAMAGRFAATAACATFLMLCGFALHQGAGNYNFVWCYSQDVLLAFFLSLSAFAVWHAWSRKPHWGRAIGLGTLVGLVFLTKAEFFGALGVGLGAAHALTPVSRADKLRCAGWCALSALLVVGIAFAALAAAMPATDALRGTLGAWPYVLGGEAGDFPLYKVAMGLVPLRTHLGKIAAWSAGSAGLCALALWVARRFGSPAGALVAGLGVALLFTRLNWTDALYPASLYMLATLGWLARRRAGGGFERAVSFGFVLFGWALLLRIALNARVQFYGFALAAPALCVVVMALCAWLPQSILPTRTQGRWVLVPLVAALVVGHLLPMHSARRFNQLELGDGADAMRVGPRGQFMGEVLAWVEANCPPLGTVCVLPEGALINYLARRKAPTRFFNFMPPEVVMFGEQEMLAELQAHPPDVIVLAHRDTIEYGVPFFGRDYAQGILAWVRANYAAAKLWSFDPKQRPFQPGTLHAFSALKKRAPG